MTVQQRHIVKLKMTDTKQQIELLNGEVWKEIESYKEYYVSNYGRVYSKYRKTLLKPYFCDTPYQRVKLYGNGICKNVTIHRLVADAFCQKYTNANIIHHIDKNQSNNKANNLKWVTAEEHKMLHKHKNKRSKTNE